MTWRIYKITDRVGRGYIGLTTRDINVRWRGHLRAARIGEQSALYNAIRKHGAEYFSIAEIAECYSAREAKTCERALIAEHGTYAHTGGGFNLTYGGDGNWGWKPTADTKTRIGAKSAERMAANPDYVRKMVAARSGHYWTGRKFSAEHVANMAKSRLGKKHTPEHIAKVANAIRGIKRTPEQIERVAATHRGKKRSAQARANISAAKKGKKMSPEAAAKMRALLNTVRHLSQTPEARAKTSAAMKVWLAVPANVEKLKLNLKQYRTPRAA